MKFLKGIYYWIQDAFYLFKGVPRMINGTAIRLPAKWCNFFWDGYERDNFLFASSVIKKNDTILDIGAHIGLFSIHLSRLAGNGGKVFAFEPTPFTWNVLMTTVKLNKVENISVQPFAVSDSNGSVVFNVIPDHVGIANSMVAIDHTVPVNVKTITIDSFRSENKIKINFLKIDVEGAEYFALRGARKTFLEDRPGALLGIHPWQIRSMNSSLEQIWDLLREYGMKICCLGRPLEKEWFVLQTELFDVELTPE